MMTVTDQMHRQVNFPFPPRRIVSLVPSQTEFLWQLGLEEELVGVTKFCVHPSYLRKQKTIIGGTKNIRLDIIAQLQPDLIIGNKEENEKDQIEWLEARYPVWLSDISTLPDAIDMMLTLGTLTNRQEQASSICEQISTGFELLSQFIKHDAQPIFRTAYFIWHQPMMVAGGDTFISEMLRHAGFSNVFGHLKRYPEANENELKHQTPEVILLSSEPFPFKEKHIEMYNRICPKAQVRLVDGEIFSWYGSRLLSAPQGFKDLRKSLIIK